MAKKKIAIKVSGGVARAGARVGTIPSSSNSIGATFRIQTRQTDTDIEKILQQRAQEELNKQKNGADKKATT